MSPSRKDILKELELIPLWRTRKNTQRSHFLEVLSPPIDVINDRRVQVMHSD